MKKIRSIKRIRSNKKMSKNSKIKSLENNISVEATKNIINTPKIANEKSPIVVKPNIVTPIKIATKTKIATKPNVITSKIAIEKSINYNKYKNRVIKQLKKHFKKLIDVKKSKYLDYDDDEYKGIKDLEHLFEEINEDDKYKRIKDLEHLFEDDDKIMICYIDWKDYNSKNGSWLKKHILWVFWNNNNVSELCDKWIFCDGNYAYTRFEELCTRSGEVLFTREHKATLSKEKSLTHIDIDALKVFRNEYFEDEIILKTNKKYKDLIDKINNKIKKLRWNKMLEKLLEKV